MIVKVIDAPNGKWIYNGYANLRVYVGEETELPDEFEAYDDNGKPQGILTARVPRWAELVRLHPAGKLRVTKGRAPVQKAEYIADTGQVQPVAVPQKKGGIPKSKKQQMIDDALANPQGRASDISLEG